MNLQRWSGYTYLGPGYAVYFGPAAETVPHAHHAIQITIGLSDSFRLKAKKNSEWKTVRGAVIPSDSVHQLDGLGKTLFFLYIDPESVWAAAVGFNHLKKTALLTPAVCKKMISRLPQTLTGKFDTDELSKFIQHIFGKKRGLFPLKNQTEPRILETIRYLNENLGSQTMSATFLAKRVGLSLGRFTHLFKEEIGLPVRPYILWTRLRRALGLALQNKDLTHIAHEAGFADSAHFSRTFQRTFGIQPSLLIKHATLSARETTPDPSVRLIP